MPCATELWLDPVWEYVSDRVMGGLSTGRLEMAEENGQHIARLTGRVSLENNGGFVQMAFDLAGAGGGIDPAAWAGLIVTLRGNDAPCEMRLRTAELSRPWQSFRASVPVASDWQTHRLPYPGFAAHRTEASFDPGALRRIGLLAIGRACDVDLAVARIGFYR